LNQPENEPTPIEELAAAAREGYGALIGVGVFCLVEYLFGIALISLAAVMLFGWMGGIARDVAWCGGALLAAVGIPFGIVRLHFLGRRGTPPPATDQDKGTPLRLVPSILVMGIVGLFIGACLGLFLLVILISVAASPFGPTSWRQGVSVGFLALSWGHPLAWQFFGYSVGLGVVIGLALGCILGPLGKVRRW